MRKQLLSNNDYYGYSKIHFINTSHFLVSKNYTRNKNESKLYGFNQLGEEESLVNQRESKFNTSFQKYLHFLLLKKSLFNEAEFPSCIEHSRKYLKKFSEVNFKLNCNSNIFGLSVQNRGKQ